MIIGNVPISFGNDEILKAITGLVCDIRSKIMAEQGRDDNSKLKKWLTGRRIVYIVTPKDILCRRSCLLGLSLLLCITEVKELAMQMLCASKAFW